MNLAEFCTDYSEGIERLKAALFRSLEAERREKLGYSLQQLLLKRGRVVRQAVEARDDVVLKQIRAVDAELQALGGRVFETIGIDIRQFLAPTAESPASGAGR